jgi:Leucine-rich repeat (LRR) protein/adenylate kinase family enzyme
MVSMEASLLSAAVTGMLKILGNKLAPLVIKEYSSIVGVKKDLQEIQDQVQEINCNLERAGDRAPKDAPWLKKLKEVVYDIDDIVDEFQLKAEKHETDGDGGFVSKCLLTKTAESLVLQCRAAKNIKKIKKRLAKIVKQRNDLTAIFGHDAVSHINKTAINMQTLPICDEASVLGRDQEMHQIISNLVQTNDKQEIKIISIVGLGGSGKTTLSKLVFNDDRTIEKHFDVRLWVHVSQEFDIEKLTKKLFEAFADKYPGQPSLAYMSKRILEGLSRKKFLIIMDDVWTESQNQWDKIMDYLKAGAPGSGVLLTTRSENVAEAVRSTYKFCLQRLSPDDSWQLFQQSFRMPANYLDSDFMKVGKEIVETCCGLPLAIKVLAGSLGGKELIGEWQAMRDILLDVEGEDSVFACLKLSYFHLPSNLKQCFTLCSLFPKGHLIDKQQLIDQWIAHDMISLTPGVDDLEHIGLRYFNSLVQVYFLQDVNEYTNGRVTCKMHDLIHDLARSILCEEISTAVPEDATSSTKGYRFFSLIEPRKLLPKKVFENARAIYVDKGNDILFGSTLKNAKCLRSIIIKNSIFSTPALNAIFQVKNLKYLEMTGLQCEALPESITDVWSLQALYLQSSNLLELPGSIGKLKRLRTLNLSLCFKLKSLPDSIGDCQMLSTLDLNGCNEFEYLPSSIGKNKRLRVLRLVSFTFFWQCCMVELPEGIGNLTKLKELDLDDFKRLPPGIGQLTQLEKLNVFCVETDKKYARISELATLSRISGKLSICFLRRLTDQSEALQACLKQKEKLRELELSWGSLEDMFFDIFFYSGTKFQSLHDMENPGHEVVALDGLEPPLGIKRITIHNYGGGRFASWMLKQAIGGVQGHGQFPCLTEMMLCDFPNLKHLDGLVQLPCLEVLFLVGMPAVKSISGGPFPSLAKVKLEGLHSLGEVWIVTDRTLSGKEGEGCSNHNPHQSGQLQIGSCLTDLLIEDCPKLVVKPHFPISLEHLWLEKSSNNLLLSPCQGQGSSSSSDFVPSFSHLKVLKLYRMEASLPLSPPPSPGFRLQLLQHMTALESLQIFLCSDITEVPECLGELCSLQKMCIMNCQSLCSLPQSIGLLSSLQELEISMCHALVQFPKGLGELRSLRKFVIYRLPGLTSLPRSTGQLTSLQELIIKECHALVQFPESLGQLTSLQELIIKECHALVQFPESLGELCSLHSFEIYDLPVLNWLPKSLCHLTSLKALSIGDCKALIQLPKGLGELCSLSKFKISCLTGLTCLPQSLCSLMSLKKLHIGGCEALRELPQCLGELHSLHKLKIWGLGALTCLPQSLCNLMSLQKLEIGGCEALRELPECLGKLHRLRKLKIWRLDSITCLPQSLCRLTTSLRELEISSCRGLKALPEWIRGLTALQLLEIRSCPDLERRCERGNGEDWYLISHIPNLHIGDSS